MREQRYSADILMGQDEANRSLQLPCRVVSHAEWRRFSGRPIHLRIAVGVAEAMEVQAPDIESGIAEPIAPRSSVKAMRNRERGREGRAVHIKHCAARVEHGVRRR